MPAALPASLSTRVRTAHVPRWKFGVAACALTLALTAPAVAQLSADEIAALRTRGAREGWTFRVAQNGATQYSIEQLCGLVIPADWRPNEDAFTGSGGRDLPPSFDWRDQDALTPVRNQGGCGSCWAFGAIGAMESAVKRFTGVDEDLSEQWLINCTTAGGCGGGLFDDAADYLMCGGRPDPCGDSGAAMEVDMPYTASDEYCACPVEHLYCLDEYGDVVENVSAIKQAIYDYGPVTTGVHSGDAFHAYSEGVFNNCEPGPVNHAVVLVGWDDTLGADGVWILRNSWGPDWGENGYMYIEYGCSSVGFATMYVVYDPPDCNQNRVADSIDITLGTSLDCNGNGVPDECDIAIGISADCNENDIPDGCEVTAGTAADCDDNGVLDECDLIIGACRDCNGNGIPDVCDVGQHTSADCNQNGVPDECEVDSAIGLAAQYFDDHELAGDSRGRLDSAVEFHWGMGSPWVTAGFGSDWFSIRWSGFVQTVGAGDYTFYTWTDDGVRLWVGNELIIDHWEEQPPTEHAGTLTLAANTAYPVVMEYFDSGGDAVAELRWQPPGLSKTVIPAERLFPGRDCDGNGRLDSCDFNPNFEIWSAALSPLGGEPQSFTVADPFDAADDVLLTFVAVGDLKFTEENVAVELNGVPVGTIYDDAHGPFFSCTPDQMDWVAVPAEMFNTLKAGGDVTVTMTPSSQIHPAACGGANFIQVGVSYVGVVPDNDCNENGVPDACDIASGDSVDADGDGRPDECAPPRCLGDLNCDGVVDFDDIDRFVEALGHTADEDWPHACPWLNADCDNSGVVDFDDIDPFVARIGAACP